MLVGTVENFQAMFKKDVIIPNEMEKVREALSFTHTVCKIWLMFASKRKVSGHF